MGYLSSVAARAPVKRTCSIRIPRRSKIQGFNRQNMNKEHRTLLRKNRVALVDDLEPRPVVNYLYQAGILTDNDVEVVNSLGTRQDKVEKILDIVPRRGPSAFDAFYKSLLLDQSHLAFLLKCNISTQGLYLYKTCLYFR